jgi:hypothetical protein
MMKKIASLFMLLIATSIAFHLSFAIHYCSGHVASVSMFGDVAGACCCGAEDDCRNEEPASPPAGYLTGDGDDACCSDKVVAMETDEYQTPAAVTLPGKPDVEVAPFIFLQSQAWQLSEIHAVSGYQIIYPPGSFPGYGIDLLTQICVLRI